MLAMAYPIYPLFMGILSLGSVARTTPATHLLVQMKFGGKMTKKEWEEIMDHMWRPWIKEPPFIDCLPGWAWDAWDRRHKEWKIRATPEQIEMLAKLRTVR